MPAIARGVETMSGQNIGDGNYDRTAATSRFVSKSLLVGLSLLGFVDWVWAAPIVSVFTSDPAVVDVARERIAKQQANDS